MSKVRERVQGSENKMRERREKRGDRGRREMGEEEPD